MEDFNENMVNLQHVPLLSFSLFVLERKTLNGISHKAAIVAAMSSFSPSWIHLVQTFLLFFDIYWLKMQIKCRPLLPEERNCSSQFP